MAFTNEDVQEIKEIVLETIAEESDPIEDVQQVSELSEGDEVPIVRSSQGVNSYGRAPVNLFGGGGGEPTEYLKDADVSQDGNTLILTKKNDSTVTFTPDTGGGYNPPQGGIPKSDLSSGVQASLDKADSAVPNTRNINGKPLSSNITLNASDVNALPSSTTIPTSLSQLNDDSTHRTVTDSEKTNWNDKYTKTEVDNMLVSAPEANVVVIENPSGADPTTLLPQTPAANTIYRVMSADGTYFSEYEHNGTKYVKLADRQYGIDNMPTPGSNNLAKSDGIANSTIPLAMSSLFLQKGDVKIICNEPGYYSNGTLYGVAGGVYVHSGLVKATPGKYKLTAYGSSTIDKIGFYNENKEYISRLSNDANQFEITIPDNVSYIRFSTSVADGGYVIVSSKELNINSKIREHNIFDYKDIIIGKAIKDTGEIWNVSVVYKLVKLYLEAGKYWIVSPGNGSQQTLWKYTDDTYSQTGAIQIIGHIDDDVPVSEVVDLEAGYYAFSWVDTNYSGITYGAASITKAWAVGETLNRIKKSASGDIDIVLPDKIYSVVGDTLQLFYQGIIKAVNPENYDILVTCAKGKQYPRYFEFTPIASDIGTTTLTIAVKDNNGNIISSKNCNLITHAAPSSPASQVNVVCFGDSLTRYGVWCKEVQRRLTGSGGTPAGANISNINLVGRMQEGGAGWFGVGGWSWNSYISNMVGYKFYVSGVTTVHVGDYYSNNGEIFRIIEVNITNGSGYISGAAAGSGTPSASGTLVFVEGSSDGDRTITFSSSEVDPANPFWDSANNKISFVPYANTYANGKIDVIVSFLSWNGVSNKGYEYFESTIKQLADVFHQEFPNGKWKLCGIPMPSINGGTGANYGATGSRTYADRYYLIGAVLEINKMYQRICNESGYSDFMEFVDVSAEFDALYNMPNAQKAVNIRNSSFTELVGTNGVHPANAGYLQIADTVYRNLVSNYC